MKTQFLREMVASSPLSSVTAKPQCAKRPSAVLAQSEDNTCKRITAPDERWIWTVTHCNAESSTGGNESNEKSPSTQSHEDFTHALSRQLTSVEQAREHLVGCTPNSPLSRKSKTEILLPSFEQSMETRLHVRPVSSARTSEVSVATRCTDRSVTPRSLMVKSANQVKMEVSPPMVGQRYVVVQPWITLRAHLDVCSHNPVVCRVRRGRAVRILRSELCFDKVRVQVLTNDENIGWCTLTTEFGEELMKLVSEEV